jgi:RimJ/RimL family protein N-acetyltransferase
LISRLADRYKVRMLRGRKVGLRARIESDVQALQQDIYNDVPTFSRGSQRPWQPISPGRPDAPYAVIDADPRHATFSAITLDGEELAGECGLWSIDLHNRTAELGIALLPAARGRGLAVDIVRTLCEYGFKTRGLHRIQIDTLADNAAMRATALRAGFTLEGQRRQAVWANGAFFDDVVYGRLADDTA